MLQKLTLSVRDFCVIAYWCAHDLRWFIGFTKGESSYKEGDFRNTIPLSCEEIRPKQMETVAVPWPYRKAFTSCKKYRSCGLGSQEGQGSSDKHAGRTGRRPHMWNCVVRVLICCDLGALGIKQVPALHLGGFWGSLANQSVGWVFKTSLCIRIEEFGVKKKKKGFISCLITVLPCNGQCHVSYKHL